MEILRSYNSGCSTPSLPCGPPSPVSPSLLPLVPLFLSILLALTEWIASSGLFNMMTLVAVPGQAPERCDLAMNEPPSQ